MDKIPIMKIDSSLLVTIQVDMNDSLAQELQDYLSDRIVKTGATGVLIEISTLEIIDSFMGRMLSNITSISKLLGAETVVVGMRPAVAITLVELGLPLAGIRTALNVERGLALIQPAQDGEGTDGSRGA
jgi:rsbT antagonist protein RsbS